MLISKPPEAAVARLVLDRVARSAKPFTICFLGASGLALPANARAAATLKAAADASIGRAAGGRLGRRACAPDRGTLVRGLFAGGTFCSEAQIVFAQAGLAGRLQRAGAGRAARSRARTARTP